MHEWMPYRDKFLDELVRHDGWGDYLECDKFPQCSSMEPPIAKCTECFGGHIVCVACALCDHAAHPLHRLHVRV